jgi:hypothetical protein
LALPSVSTPADKSKFSFLLSGQPVAVDHLEALRVLLVPGERDVFTLSLSDMDWGTYIETCLFGLTKHVFHGRLLDVTRPASKSR